LSNSESLRKSLNVLYEALQEELVVLPAKCYGCGKCCNFKENGMQLFAQKLEKDLIVEETGVEPFLVEKGHCNFQENGLCTIHPIRPLGCRTYFSEAPNSVAHQDLYEKYHRKIKNIGNENQIDYQFVPFFGSKEIE
jgi:Fe-S-cluster containining protein